jgi:serine-type D-Ala-D-Ala carboxypeptidase (penicillin-binding protein 5/6)
VTVRPRRVAAALIAAVALLIPSAPAAAQTPPKPSVSAETAVVIDARTGETLYAKAANRRHAIASTTKLMTALVARERAELDDVFPATDYRPAAVESQIRLREGERLSFHDLLEALLLPSANDAAMAIAEGVAGSRSEFVDLMNEKAEQLGLERTSFANPIGLDDPDNYSTALELAQLTRVLLRDRAIARIADSPRARLTTGARPRTVNNRNRLVAQHPFVDGVKTGRTQRAGYVLVGSATQNGVKVISVVTGAPSEGARDADSLALLRYGIGQYRRARVLTEGRRVAFADVKYFEGDRVRLVPQRGLALTVRRGERVRRVVRAPEELEGPIARGERVGAVEVVYRDRVVRRVPLVTAMPVPEAGMWDKLSASLGESGLALAFLALAALAGIGALRIRTGRRRGRQQVRGARSRR